MELGKYYRMPLFNNIYEWVKNTPLNRLRRDEFIEQFKEEDFLVERVKIFDELAGLTNSNPQEIVNLTRNQIKNNQSITFLITFIFNRNSKKEIGEDSDGLIFKIAAISAFWETRYLFKFPAYLLSKKRFDIYNSKERKSILQYFKFSGLSKNDIENIRRIRNAHFHPFTFRNGVLINDRNEEVVDFEKISLIYEKIGKLCNWWLSTLIFLFYYNPHFAIIVFFSAVDEIWNNKQLYKEYITPFYSLFPSNNEEKLEHEKPPILAIWITNGWQFLKNPIQGIKRHFFKKVIEGMVKNNTPIISEEQILSLLNEFQRRQIEFGEEMNTLSEKLTFEGDKRSMKKLAKSIMLDANKKIETTGELNKRMINLMKRKFEEGV